MLYEKNKEKKLSEELFKSPTSEYRGAPFWAWNTELSEDELLRQIEIFKEMGLGGFHIHVRSGMATKYLSEKFMSLIKKCNEKAKSEGMLTWLYDEDRYASGAAGGYVTKNRILRRKAMIITSEDPASSSLRLCKDFEEFKSSCEKGEKPDGYLAARFDIEFDEENYLKSYRALKDNEPKGENTWFAYIEVNGDDPWYNGEAYLDTMKKEAVDRFIEVTHERYAEWVGSDFGKSIPAIFTDEPQVNMPKYPALSGEGGKVILAFTDDLEDTYKELYGESLIEKLPLIVWQTRDDSSALARYRYIDHRCERFVSAFCDNIGAWCQKNGPYLTGHLMNEPTLGSQSDSLGEAMRCYRSFGIPGIDILCDFVELSSAKQAQSALHQFGREAMLSELYGVTGWNYDFRGHKRQGDWQAALGVTVRVHHLTWVSMNGEAKRDYPASIGYQSPWYKEYRLIEDHFARLNTALTRGKPSVKVGIIHPIESYWLYCGVNDKTALRREYLDKQFSELTKAVSYSGIDFDFISESLLPSLCPAAGNPLKVGRMEYDCIIIPAIDTMRSTTLEILKKFGSAGGKVIMLGSPAFMVDAKRSAAVEEASKAWLCLDIDSTALIGALEPFRFADFTDLSRGVRCGNFLHQIRDDGENGEKWFFICHGENTEGHAPSYAPELVRITFKGKYSLTEYDTMSGNIYTPSHYVKGGKTYLERAFYATDSLLLRLTPTEDDELSVIGDAPEEMKSYSGGERLALKDSFDYTLSEDNVLLLDRCEYAFDKGEWQNETDSLLVSDMGRKLFFEKHQGQRRVQPWVEIPEELKKDLGAHLMRRRFRFESEIPLSGACLALELSEISEIKLNGKKIPNASIGYFTDKCIKKIPLPSISAGENIIEILTPFELRTCSEWCYITGDFGVRTEGRKAIITERKPKLCFGDTVPQSLPFYSGNIIYHTSFTEPKGKRRTLQIPHFAGALIKISLDGKEVGYIMKSPYSIELGEIEIGEHSLDITLYGTRANSFGPLHNTLLHTPYYWYGPGAWRTQGLPEWSDAYIFEKYGILDTPIIF